MLLPCRVNSFQILKRPALFFCLMPNEGRGWRELFLYCCAAASSALILQLISPLSFPEARELLQLSYGHPPRLEESRNQIQIHLSQTAQVRVMINPALTSQRVGEV